MNFRFIARSIGQLQMILALSMLAPLLWSLAYRDGDHWAIVLSMAATFGVGALLFFTCHRAPEEFYRREALAVVGLGWTLCAITGSLPFVFSGLLGPVDAVFETMSGLTTTGATVIEDINGALQGEEARHGVMFWRSFTHWLGGMGIIVLLLALLPAVGAGTKFLFKSEVPGVQAEGLKPRIRQTAMRLWLLYVGLSVLEFLCLWALGMSVYDAMCQTFGTMATGGFSTENDSVGGFQSLPIELVIMVFMFLAGTSFNLHYQVAHRRWFAWVKDPEWRAFALLFVGCTLFITADLHLSGLGTSGAGGLMRDASFSVLSVQTTTGFCTADFDAWPTSSKTVLVTLMFIGGCAGSTGGGMKVIRWLLLFRIAHHQTQRIFNPRRVQTMRLAGRVIDDDVQHLALVFFFVWLMIFLIASIVMSTMVEDVVTGVTSVAATLNNIGPGLAGVGPTQTYAPLPAMGKIVLIFCMVVGRLELWAILCLFAPGFWWTRRAR